MTEPAEPADGGSVDAGVPSGSDDPEGTRPGPDAADPATADESPAGAGEAGESGHDAPVSVEELVDTLERVTAERDQHLADLQRTAADFANFRKQTEKRNAELAAQAGSRVAEALLPVLDACDAAAHQGIEGVEQIAGQLTQVLVANGLEIIHDVGEPFDPTRHEAAMSEPDDDQDVAVVDDVLRTGYAWNGRVLRAAMVKVRG